MIPEVYSTLMFIITIVALMIGYPVGITLCGVSILFGVFGFFIDIFDPSFFQAFPSRLFGIMENQILISLPLFIFMGVILEKCKISEALLETMGILCGSIKGGLGISICIVGALMAASTGIVGATVIAMGLLSLPTMIKYKYNPSFATGIITASGTLGQIIPPSIILIILGSVISNAYQKAQLQLGNFSSSSISVGDLFLGALIPGLLLVVLYIIYIFMISLLYPNLAPPVPLDVRKQYEGILIKRTFQALVPPILLIIGVLGSILLGIATPTEAASVGCIGSLLLAYYKGQLKLPILKNIMERVTHINCMIFLILIGSSMFSLVFRGYNGDDVISNFLTSLPGGQVSAFLLVMVLIFILGFFLDFFEITFVVVPIVGPILLNMGFDPVWLGVMIALNLQTSFLTPPFGFALFYLRGVAPPSIKTTQMYMGVIPFICIQLLILIILWYVPQLAIWLPKNIYG